MARGERGDLRVKSMGLGPRFVLSMTVPLILVMAVAAALLAGAVSRITTNARDDALTGTVRLKLDQPDVNWKQRGAQVVKHESGVQIFPVEYGDPAREGMVYLVRKRRGRFDDKFDEEALLVPGSRDVTTDAIKIALVISVLVVLVGAGVALWAAKQVTRPLKHILEDIRQIAKGNLAHKTHVRGGGGEIELLARTIDRMTRELEDAQEAHVELSVRERELDVATGVREALLPLATPMLDGYDIGAAHVSAAEIGGDFHDFVELPDGRLGLLVCEVSGEGIPAALVGATARSYLRAVLARGEDVVSSFQQVNRWLGGDVRRGMFVTGLYALVDPGQARATVICAGHKLPLVRVSAEDGKLRVVHPEGIAMGLDKGPVFDRRIEAVEVPLEPGDRLVLANSGPVVLQDERGRELGEKAFFGRVLKHASKETPAFLKALKRDLLQFAGEAERTRDLTLVTIERMGA